MLAMLIAFGKDVSKKKYKTESCSVPARCNEQNEADIETHDHGHRGVQPEVFAPELPPNGPKESGPDIQEMHRPWLPPLQFQLASTPEEQLTEFVSPHRPLLARSRTCATISSSLYSGSRSASCSAMSRHPSTTSFLSSQTFNSGTQIASKVPSKSVQQPPLPPVPQRYRHRGHSLREGGTPVRPGSRPAMPPVEFWKYASNRHMRRISVSTSANHRLQSARKQSGKREPSVCRYPILATPAKPVCRTRRATVHSEIGHIKTASYESLRKGPLDNVHRTRSTTSIAETEAPSGATAYKMGGRHHVEPGTKKRESRTLIKQRQPNRR